MTCLWFHKEYIRIYVVFRTFYYNFVLIQITPSLIDTTLEFMPLLNYLGFHKEYTWIYVALRTSHSIESILGFMPLLNYLGFHKEYTWIYVVLRIFFITILYWFRLCWIRQRLHLDSCPCWTILSFTKSILGFMLLLEPLLYLHFIQQRVHLDLCHC